MAIHTAVTHAKTRTLDTLTMPELSRALVEHAVGLKRRCEHERVLPTRAVNVQLGERDDAVGHGARKARSKSAATATATATAALTSATTSTAEAATLTRPRRQSRRRQRAKQRPSAPLVPRDKNSSHRRTLPRYLQPDAVCRDEVHDHVCVRALLHDDRLHTHTVTHVTACTGLWASAGNVDAPRSQCRAR